MDTKICRKCGIEKPIGEFYPDKRRKIGIRSVCKICNNLEAAQWAKNNTEKVKDKNNRFSKSEKGKQRRRRYYLNHWQEMKERNAKKQKENPDYYKIANHRREARLKGFEYNFTQEDWIKCLEFFNYSCAVCGQQHNNPLPLVPDHWIPISNPNCPGTTPSNIIPLCHGKHSCNTSKRNMDGFLWLKLHCTEEKARDIYDKIVNYLTTIL